MYHSTIRIVNTKFYSTRIPDQQKSYSITKKIHRFVSKAPNFATAVCKLWLIDKQ